MQYDKELRGGRGGGNKDGMSAEGTDQQYSHEAKVMMLAFCRDNSKMYSCTLL